MAQWFQLAGNDGRSCLFCCDVLAVYVLNFALRLSIWVWALHSFDTDFSDNLTWFIIDFLLTKPIEYFSWFFKTWYCWINNIYQNLKGTCPLTPKFTSKYSSYKCFFTYIQSYFQANWNTFICKRTKKPKN